MSMSDATALSPSPLQEGGPSPLPGTSLPGTGPSPAPLLARDLVIRAHAPALALALSSIERTARAGGTGLPIMKSLHVACLPGDRHVRLGTSNLDIWQSRMIDADVRGLAPDAPDSERSIVLGSIETLAPWIASIAAGSAGDIEICAKPGASSARVTCGRASVGVALYPADAYPAPPEATTRSWSLLISPASLLRILESTSPFVSRDSGRKHLGIALQPVCEGEGPGNLRAVATDTHSLSLQYMPLVERPEGIGQMQGTSETQGGTIEGPMAVLAADSAAIAALKLLAQSALRATGAPSGAASARAGRAGEGQGETARQESDGAHNSAIRLLYAPDANVLLAWHGRQSLVARLCATPFPSWPRVIPSPAACVSCVTLDTQSLEASLRRVALAAAGRMDRIHLSWHRAGEGQGEELTLAASSSSGEAQESIPAQVRGEAGSLYLASALLQRALAACPTEGIGLHFQGPLRPLLLLPSGDARPGCEGTQAWQGVVMPMYGS